MADSARSSITIAAEPEAIMDVIADFPAYPQWTGSVRSAEVVEAGQDGERARQVHFLLDAGVVKDDYVLEYEWDGTRRVDWHLVRGKVQRRQVGSYVLAPADDGTTHVTYELEVDLSIPMIGMFKRKAEKVIIDTALKELKKRVEGR